MSALPPEADMAATLLGPWQVHGVLFLVEDYENPQTRKTVKGLRFDDSKKLG